MSTIAIDRTKPIHGPKDAFEVHGYRQMAMRMVILGLRELNSTDKAISNESRFWFDPIKGENAKISMEDCMALMGCSSALDTVRDIAFSGDRNKIEQLANSIESRLSEQQKTAHADNVQKDNFVVEPRAFHDLQMAFR